MIYKRVFTFPMSHFNGEPQYVDFDRSVSLIEEARGEADLGSYNNKQLKAKLEKAIEAHRLMVEVLKNVHGHNLTVTIEAKRRVEEGKRGSSFVVVDEELDEMLKPWHFMNLSVHEDFNPKTQRPGCELIALRLLQKLTKRYPSVYFKISVAETDGQVATVDERKVGPSDI